MRRHPVTGQIAHGIAGDGVYVDGTQISPGGGQSGMPDWMGDQVIHCAEAGVTLRNADGSSPTLVGVPANFVRASSHGWASWSPERGVFTSWGLTLPSAVLLDMAPDGTMLVGDNYQSGVGISAYRSGSTTPLWRVPTARPELRFPYSQAAILDDKTACWTENVGGRQVLVGFGLTAGPRPPWNVLHARLFKVNGEVWVVYLRSEDDRTIAHPWNYVGLGFSVPGFGYGPEGWQDGALVTLAWSIGAGEKATDIKGQTFNLAALEVIPSLPEPVPVKPIGPTSDPLPEGTEIDLAPFLAYDPAVWPRGGDQEGGDEHAIDMQPVTHKGEPCFWHAVFGKDGKGRLGSLVQIKDGFLHLLADCHNRDQGGVGKGFIDTWSHTGWLPLKMRIGRQYGWTAPDHTIRKHRDDGTIFNEHRWFKEQWIHKVWPRFWCGPDLGERMVVQFAQNNTGIKAGQTTTDPGFGMESDYLVFGAGRCRWTYDRAMDVFVGPDHAPIFPDTPLAQSDFWHVGGPRYPPVIPEWLPLASEVTPVATRPMTDSEKSIVNAFAGAFPPPHGDGSEAWLDRAYRHLPDGWMAKLCQQLRFSLGANYGHKRRNGSAPLSAGSFAVREGDMMQVFDILVGVGSGTPRVDVHVESLAVHLTGPEAQEFVEVAAVNHLNIQPPTNRPALTLPLWGVTAFDLAARVSLGDWRFYDLIRANKLVPRVNVYATIDHPATGRLYRTFTTGMAQMRVLLPRMVQDSMKGQFIMFVGTTPDGVSRSQALDMLRQQNALFQQFASAVAGLQIGNEVVYPGLEEPYLSDPSFCREAEVIIDARFPLTWGAGHGGQPVNMAGGSYLVHHSDRDLSPDAAGAILAEAQRIAKRPVVDDEPRRIEANGGGQSTGDLNFVRGLIANAKRHGYGLTMHPAAGRGCSVDFLDDVQREAIRLTGIEAQAVTPIPPPGHPILDADMRNAATFYPLFINRRPEFESVAVAWYTKSKGHGPADPDIAHGLYWRAMREWQHFGTLRRAFEDTWPGGAP